MSASTYSYAYDDIGNRKWATVGVSSNTYTANPLNQYYAVTNAGAWLPLGYDLDGNMTRKAGNRNSSRLVAWLWGRVGVD